MPLRTTRERDNLLGTPVASHRFSTAFPRTAMSAALLARVSGCAVRAVAVAGAFIFAVSVAADEWTAADVVAIMAARDAEIRTVDATIMIVEGASAEISEYYGARVEAARKLAALTGEALSEEAIKALDARNVGPKTTSFRRAARDEKRRERIEILSSNGQQPGPAITKTVFDGNQWRTLGPKQGLIHGSKDAESPLDYLGIGFHVRDEAAIESGERSMHEFLAHKLASGRLVIAPGVSPDADGRRLVTVVTRDPVAQQVLRDAGVITQHTFWLDPGLGMAPVKMEVKDVYADSSGQIHDTVPCGAKTAEWQGYEQTGGVWLPRKWHYFVTAAVVFPKDGAAYPSGLNLRSAGPSDFSEKRFRTLEIEATAVSLSVNAQLSPDLFVLKFPPGTGVYNSLNKKTYQVGESGNLVESAVMAAAAAPKPESGRVLFHRVLIAVNLAVVAIVAVILSINHFRSRSRRS